MAAHESKRSVTAPGRRRRMGLLVALLVATGGWSARAQQPATEISAAQIEEVMPAATRVERMAGDPAAAPAYRDDELIGYVFRTREVVQSVGYSGKPLDVLVGLDLDARITGATLLEQHEPILVIGVSH